MAKVYKGSQKVRITVQTGIDLTLATSYVLLVLKPDGRNVEWIPTIDTPATAGNLGYTTDSAGKDLDVSGTYYIQSKVGFAGSVLYYGETGMFKIWEYYK